MLCSSGFELYSRWLPLKIPTNFCICQITIFISTIFTLGLDFLGLYYRDELLYRDINAISFHQYASPIDFETQISLQV